MVQSLSHPSTVTSKPSCSYSAVATLNFVASASPVDLSCLAAAAAEVHPVWPFTNCKWPQEENLAQSALVSWWELKGQTWGDGKLRIFEAYINTVNAGGLWRTGICHRDVPSVVNLRTKHKYLWNYIQKCKLSWKTYYL